MIFFSTIKFEDPDEAKTWMQQETMSFLPYQTFDWVQEIQRTLQTQVDLKHTTHGANPASDMSFKCNGFLSHFIKWL